MSLYQFAPIASHPNNPGFVTWDNGFSDDEIEAIKRLCDQLKQEPGTVGTAVGNADPQTIAEVRTSKVSWLTRTNDSEWIYERLAFIARKLNAEFYNFDLYGFVEDMQYTVYEGDVSGHYTWHLDISGCSTAPRKFSLVLQLSDPSEYEGGHLQVQTEPEPATVTKQKGLVTAFPSWTLHRVTPVTSGVRRTLVVWVAGPQFR